MNAELLEDLLGMNGNEAKDQAEKNILKSPIVKEEIDKGIEGYGVDARNFRLFSQWAAYILSNDNLSDSDKLKEIQIKFKKHLGYMAQ